MDPLNDGGLADVANVDGGAEATEDLCGVEEDADTGLNGRSLHCSVYGRQETDLEVLAGLGLFPLWTGGHPPPPQLEHSPQHKKVIRPGIV